MEIKKRLTSLRCFSLSSSRFSIFSCYSVVGRCAITSSVVSPGRRPNPLIFCTGLQTDLPDTKELDYKGLGHITVSVPEA